MRPGLPHGSVISGLQRTSVQCTSSPMVQAAQGLFGAPVRLYRLEAPELTTSANRH